MRPAHRPAMPLSIGNVASTSRYERRRGGINLLAKADYHAARHGATSTAEPAPADGAGAAE
eukprot:7128518-Prymnesium_polylepis.1